MHALHSIADQMIERIRTRTHWYGHSLLLKEYILENFVPCKSLLPFPLKKMHFRFGYSFTDHIKLRCQRSESCFFLLYFDWFSYLYILSIICCAVQFPNHRFIQYTITGLEMYQTIYNKWSSILEKCLLMFIFF